MRQIVFSWLKIQQFALCCLLLAPPALGSEFRAGYDPQELEEVETDPEEATDAPEVAPPSSQLNYCDLKGAKQNIVMACELVNKKRAQFGARPVKLDTALNAAALAHAKDMHERRYFSHDTPEGIQPKQRLNRARIPWLATGENLSWQEAGADPVAAVDGWMKSKDGHRETLLDKSYRKLGFACYADFCVQEFTD